MGNYKKTLYFFTLCWLSICTICVGLLVSNHYIVFKPSDLLPSTNEIKNSKWTLHHILGVGCGCSETVYQYLKSRGPESEFNEVITVIGDNQVWINSLKAVGFTVQSVNENSLNTDEMFGVPYLAIYNQKNQPIYKGGYGEHFIKKQDDILDLKIVKSLQGRGKAPKVFPIFGCASNLKYKKIFDPFNLKSGKVGKL